MFSVMEILFEICDYFRIQNFENPVNKPVNLVKCVLNPSPYKVFNLYLEAFTFYWYSGLFCCWHDWFICFMQKSSAIISELSLSRGCFFFQLTFFRLSRDNLKIRHLGEEFLQTFYRISNFNTKFFGAIYLYLQKDSGTLYTSYLTNVFKT